MRWFSTQASDMIYSSTHHSHHGSQSISRMKAAVCLTLSMREKSSMKPINTREEQAKVTSCTVALRGTASCLSTLVVRRRRGPKVRKDQNGRKQSRPVPPIFLYLFCPFLYLQKKYRNRTGRGRGCIPSVFAGSRF